MFRDFRLEIWQFYNFCIFNVFVPVSIEKQIMNSPAGIFCNMNILLVILTYMCHAELQFRIVKMD